MGIFGKILIVLNLLAMGGVAYLASLDWAKRQEWAFAALTHEIKVVGLPVEGPNPPPSDLDPKDYAPFVFSGESGKFTEIRRTTLGQIVPPGIDPWGSGTVASQEEEVKRLEGAVFSRLEQGSALEKRNLLTTLLLNLAETGEERDGVFALLSGVLTPGTSRAARAELAYLAPGPSQQSGLSALLAVAEYQRSLRGTKKTDEAGTLREAARNALVRLAVADLPFTITLPSAGSRQERYRTQLERTNERSKPALLNLIQASLRVNVTEQELRPLRDAVRDKGTDDREKAQLLRIAQLVGNLLDSDPKIADAINQISTLIVERGESEAEKKALDGLLPLVRGVVGDTALDSTVQNVGQLFLRLRFSDAQLPVAKPGVSGGELTGKAVQTVAEKRTRIAHILYHIDADRNWSERATWHRRVAVIVGINAYAETVEAQATRLNASAQRVEQLILNEQNVFEAQYAALVREAQYLADLLNTVEGQLVEQKRVVDEYQTDVNQRTTERDALVTNLATARKTAKGSLTNFREKQNELLDATKKLRDAQDSIGKLEADIRRLEGEIKGRRVEPENKGR